jgi:hypothetical protein
MKRVLLLCHGNLHGICNNENDFMLSIEMIKDCITLDEDSTCKPDIIEDFRDRTSLPENSFLCVMCIGWLPLNDFNEFEHGGIENIERIITETWHVENLELEKDLLRHLDNKFIENMIKVTQINGYVILGKPVDCCDETSFINKVCRKYHQLQILKTVEDYKEYGDNFLSLYFWRNDNDNYDFIHTVENQIEALINNECNYFVFKKIY